MKTEFPSYYHDEPSITGLERLFADFDYPKYLRSTVVRGMRYSVARNSDLEDDSFEDAVLCLLAIYKALRQIASSSEQKGALRSVVDAIRADEVRNAEFLDQYEKNLFRPTRLLSFEKLEKRNQNWGQEESQLEEYAKNAWSPPYDPLKYNWVRRETLIQSVSGLLKLLGRHKSLERAEGVRRQISPGDPAQDAERKTTARTPSRTRSMFPTRRFEDNEDFQDRRADQKDELAVIEFLNKMSVYPLDDTHPIESLVFEVFCQELLDKVCGRKYLKESPDLHVEIIYALAFRFGKLRHTTIRKTVETVPDAIVNRITSQTVDANGSLLNLSPKGKLKACADLVELVPGLELEPVQLALWLSIWMRAYSSYEFAQTDPEFRADFSFEDKEDFIRHFLGANFPEVPIRKERKKIELSEWAKLREVSQSQAAKLKNYWYLSWRLLVNNSELALTLDQLPEHSPIYLSEDKTYQPFLTKMIERLKTELYVNVPRRKHAPSSNPRSTSGESTPC